uniref:Putative conserved secreted protein n=1 Tax=Culex tarsalis TaxID=7177 RepID=A0A1Q3FQF8_CULTA
MKFSAAIAATPLTIFLIFTLFAIQQPTIAAENGKYDKKKYGHGNHGKYTHTTTGDYVDDLDRYRYVHYDDGDRGRYIHVHVPYDGGFGNYEGGHEPFRNPPYDASGLYAYVQRPQNESCLRLLEQYSKTCSDSSVKGPFQTTEFDIRKPPVYTEYGTPYPELNYGASSQQIKKTSSATGTDPRASNFPGLGYLPVPKPSKEYLPPAVEHRGSGSSNQIKVVHAENRTFSVTTGSGEQIATKIPEKQTRITLAQRPTTEPSTTPRSTTTTTKTTTTASIARSTTHSLSATTAAPSIEQQLHQCQLEVESLRQKLSHYEAADRQ